MIEKPLNLEKMTSSDLFILLLIYDFLIFTIPCILKLFLFFGPSSFKPIMKTTFGTENLIYTWDHPFLKSFKSFLESHTLWITLYLNSNLTKTQKVLDDDSPWKDSLKLTTRLSMCIFKWGKRYLLKNWKPITVDF